MVANKIAGGVKVTPKHAACITLLGLAVAGSPGVSHAQVLHFFGEPGDGANPFGGVIMDPSGALYGTTYSGGTATDPQGYPFGTVYRLIPPASGHGPWTEQVLHDFPQSDTDGELPYGNLLMDKAGALYGITHAGQSSQGTAYKLTPPASGTGEWTETILHTFTSAAANQDGEIPVGGLVADASGTLYGVTSFGGSSFTCGTVFMLSPPPAGRTAWAYQVLHEFAASGDGCEPEARLTMDHNGNLFGTTQAGGVGSDTRGTVFEVSPPAPGQTQWTERVLASFPAIGADSPPAGAVAIAPNGTLYGNTYSGGRAPCHCGGVYALRPNALGAYRPSIIYSFTASPDGAVPYSDVTRDEAGNLYGTTLYGGTVLTECKRGCGTVYKLTPPADGQGSWTETTFATSRQYGKYPQAGVLVAPDGKLYGTTGNGGRHQEGTTFSLPLAVLDPR
jgi:uncharacterized repeat protein (TIGR03803 family)